VKYCRVKVYSNQVFDAVGPCCCIGPRKASDIQQPYALGQMIVDPLAAFSTVHAEILPRREQSRLCAKRFT